MERPSPIHSAVGLPSQAFDSEGAVIRAREQHTPQHLLHHWLHSRLKGAQASDEEEGKESPCTYQESYYGGPENELGVRTLLGVRLILFLCRHQ